MSYDSDDLLDSHDTANVPATIESKSHVITDHAQREKQKQAEAGKTALDAERYDLHDHLVLLPGQILTEAIARLRFTIVLVSFFYSGLFFVFGILAICLVAPNILYFLDRSSPILLDTAKIMISLVALTLALGAIAVTIKHNELTSRLALAEVLIDHIQDVALIQLQSTRYTLEELTERLKFPKEPQHASAFDYLELAKKIGPVISLLMARERSVITIAVEGLKLFQALKKVFNK